MVAWSSFLGGSEGVGNTGAGSSTCPGAGTFVAATVGLGSNSRSRSLRCPACSLTPVLPALSTDGAGGIACEPSPDKEPVRAVLPELLSTDGGGGTAPSPASAPYFDPFDPVTEGGGGTTPPAPVSDPPFPPLDPAIDGGGGTACEASAPALEFPGDLAAPATDGAGGTTAGPVPDNAFNRPFRAGPAAPCADGGGGTACDPAIEPNAAAPASPRAP